MLKDIAEYYGIEFFLELKRGRISDNKSEVLSGVRLFRLTYAFG